jgi:hypothetical protein
LSSLFSGFRTIKTTLLSQDAFRLRLFNFTDNFTKASPTDNRAFISILTDISSTNTWNPVQSVVFTSGVIPGAGLFAVTAAPPVAAIRPSPSAGFLAAGGLKPVDALNGVALAWDTLASFVVTAAPPMVAVRPSPPAGFSAAGGLEPVDTLGGAALAWVTLASFAAAFGGDAFSLTAATGV